MFEHRIEHGMKVVRRSGHADSSNGLAVTRDCRDDGKRQMIIALSQVEEQLLHFFEHLSRSGILSVDLVDHQNDWKVSSECFPQDVPSLGKRALSSIDEQDHPIDERQRTLHLPTKIGVTRRVDQIDAGSSIVDLCGLCQDGDSAFALLVVVVHHTIDHCLVGGERTGVAQQRIDERRLSVVDVRNERNVTNGGTYWRQDVQLVSLRRIRLRHHRSEPRNARQ